MMAYPQKNYEQVFVSCERMVTVKTSENLGPSKFGTGSYGHFRSFLFHARKLRGTSQNTHRNLRLHLPTLKTWRHTRPQSYGCI